MGEVWEDWVARYAAGITRATKRGGLVSGLGLHRRRLTDARQSHKLHGFRSVRHRALYIDSPEHLPRQS